MEEQEVRTRAKAESEIAEGEQNNADQPVPEAKNEQEQQEQPPIDDASLAAEQEQANSPQAEDQPAPQSPPPAQQQAHEGEEQKAEEVNTQAYSTAATVSGQQTGDVVLQSPPPASIEVKREYIQPIIEPIKGIDPSSFDPYGPLQQSQAVQIGITDHCVKNPDFKPKYVQYKVSGRDLEGNEFGVWRKFNEFVTLRELLLESWPGCCIPPLPEKVLVNSTEWEFINQRTRILNGFLKKLALMKHIFVSQVVQVFLRYAGEECQKEMQILPKPSPTRTIDTYSKLYRHLQGKDITTDSIVDITRFTGLLNRCQALLKIYEHKLIELAQAQKQHLRNIAQIADLFLPEYERALLSTYTNDNPDATVFLNQNNKNLHQLRAQLFQSSQQKDLQFKLVADFFNAEILEAQAHMEMIGGRDKIEKKKSEFEQKIKASQTELENLRSGKSTLRSLFKSGSKEQQIELEQEKLRQLKEEYENYQKLGDIVTAIIAFEQIFIYKQERTTRYEVLWKIISKGEWNQLQLLSNYWQEVNTLAVAQQKQ